jgi:hypothetical protein
MTLISHLLQVTLAVLLAYLGGALLRGARPASGTGISVGRARDRLLGVALHLAAAFLGNIAAAHLGGFAGHPGHAMPTSPVAAPLVALLWLGAVGLGLRRPAGAAGMRRLSIAAVVLLVLLLAGAGNEFSRADLFLLLGLTVWLGVTLLSPRRTDS